MSKKDNELKDAISFFVEEDVNGTITVELYTWNSSVERSALNNLKNKNLLACSKSKLFSKCLEYKATDKLKQMAEILKPMGRAQRLKHIKEQYRCGII